MSGSEFRNKPVFSPHEPDSYSPPIILTPFLAPHPAKIPTELQSDDEFYTKFYIQFTPVNVIIIVCILLFSLWVILMNTLVIIGLLKKQKIHGTDYYLINLAVMDIIEGFIVIPLMGIVVIVGYFPLGRPMCHIWVFVDYLLIVTSSIGFCVLLLNFVWMIRFGGAQRNRTHLIVILLVWLISLACWVPAFIHNFTRDFDHGVCGYSNGYNRYYTLSIGIVGFFLPLVISIVCAIYSAVILRKKVHERLFYARRLDFDVKSSPVFRKRLWSKGVIFETNHILTSQAQAKKDFPLVIYLLFLFIVCRIIFYIYFGVGALLGKVFPPDLSNGLYWLMHVNAALSPIIHIVFDSDLREGLRAMFCCGKKSTLVLPFVDANGNTENHQTVISTLSQLSNEVPVQVS